MSSLHPYCHIAILLAVQALGLQTSVAQDVRSVLQERCVHCHNAEEQKGNVDLTSLASPSAPTDKPAADHLWTRVEKMVSAKKMPPADEEPLIEQERQRIIDWYRDQYILRDGKEHLGITPLRRLTRYELENTLEDLLAVQLKQPYVFSSESAGLEPSTIEQLYPADSPGESGFDNDATRLRQVKSPLLKLIACIDFALRKFDQTPTARMRVLGLADRPATISPDAARKILDRFADQAFRGQHNAAEREAIFNVWQAKAIDGNGAGYDGLLQAMKATLLSPSFIYRLETQQNSADPYRVSGRELAVRLSYFLWSSMPDEALWAAAEEGSLQEDQALMAQVERMLNSPQRLTLSENFAGQWLGFDELQRNKVFYAGENWTRGAYDELLFGFDELIKSDRSILEIVDADWAYLRPAVARGAKARRLEEKFANIVEDRRRRTGLKVERFYSPPKLYQAPNDRVGGLLTTAGIMRLTSAPSRTNPIRRGVWLLEKVIGERMEPPENIPPLAEAEKRVSKELAGSPAEILKVHTASESCRVCHQHIDPLGLGLENFGPQGDWRTRYPNKTPIASSGVLPNGRQFNSPKELKRELLAYYQDQIVENVIRQMLAYAMGRALQPHDRVTVERIQTKLKASDYRMGVLIQQIVLSDAFRCRQDRL